MIEAALAQNAARRERTLMVGDAVFDMQMARAANVHAIGVTWGTNDRGGLLQSGAQAVVDSVADLESAIQSFIGL
jgi:phosphoglycolate phosphatase